MLPPASALMEAGRGREGMGIDFMLDESPVRSPDCGQGKKRALFSLQSVVLAGALGPELGSWVSSAKADVIYRAGI